MPWARLTWWNTLFTALYFFRSVSLDVWLASRKTEIEFGELKFGETTLSAIRQILARVPIKEDSTVYDLGCGRGRAAFLIHFLTGARVVGLDLVGPFIVTGRRLARWMGCDQHVIFGYENFLQSHLRDADVIYACALCLNQDTREMLAAKLSHCEPGTYIVTVGWNPKRKWLEDLDSFTASFSWGRATVYVKRVSGLQDSSLSVDEDSSLAPTDPVANQGTQP